MNLMATYYAIEIKDEHGIWYRPANWMVAKKWIPDRVRQLVKEGKKVRVKEIKEYWDEKIVDWWWK
jgi:phenolic acid decarboxylase